MGWQALYEQVVAYAVLSGQLKRFAKGPEVYSANITLLARWKRVSLAKLTDVRQALEYPV